MQECARQILSLNDEGLPVLNITPEEAKKGRCVECLACEVDCFFQGAGGGQIELPIPGWTILVISACSDSGLEGHVMKRMRIGHA